ncbi:MAG: phosphatidate cytidylyltransferase [Bacteroidota bacterium]
MLKRVQSAVIGILIAISAIYLGDWWLTAGLLVVAAIASQELFWLFEEKGYRPARYLGITACLAIYALTQISGASFHAPFLVAVFVLSFLFLILRSAPWDFMHIKLPKLGNVNLSPPYTPGISSISDVATTFLGILYCGWLPSHIILIRQLDRGLAFIVLLFMTIFATDIGAYFVGKAFGKHPLTPVSPKKTVEGSLGGLLFTIPIAMLVGWLFALSLWKCALLAPIISIIAQISDLSESLIKRDAGKKDSGEVIPGHGGMLDRVDSFILSSAVAYYFILFFW